MRITTSTIVAVLATMLVNCGVAAAAWQPIGSGREKIDIDRSRIGRAGDGLVTLWSRASLPQSVADAEGKYNSVEALNRYDCTGNRFATLKRLYLFDNTLVRVEKVLAPREVGVNAGSVDAVIIDEICKSNPQKSSLAALRADMQKAVDTVTPDHIPGFMAVAEGAPAAPAAIAPPRFISLPRIDPSLIQHPTDEPKPAEVAKKAEKAGRTEASRTPPVRSEAAKAGVLLSPKGASRNGLDQQAHEIELATSSARRRAVRQSGMEEHAAEVAHKEAHKETHWSYEGDGAPSKWAKLRPDFSLCESGQRQSPIDIHEGIHVDLEPIRFDYRESMFRIIDNGHTVQVNVGEGNSISVMGRTYRLVQLHFHRPSEERIDGRSFEMVMHLVHKDDEGRLAVVAVLIEPGAEHPVVQTFWNNLPLETNLELAPATAVDVNKLLPDTRNYYTYMGSLTTPPCSEGVLWLVLKKPLQISVDQIAIFSRLYRNNARPIQPANGRLIKDSR